MWVTRNNYKPQLVVLQAGECSQLTGMHKKVFTDTWNKSTTVLTAFLSADSNVRTVTVGPSRKTA